MLAIAAVSAASATEFITNGGLLCALTKSGRCESSTGAYTGWSLTSGSSWYDDDVLKTNSMGCANPSTVTIVQSFAIPGNLPYTLSFKVLQQQWPDPGNTVWNLGYAKATVYYYSNTSQTNLIGSDTTGNVTGTSRGNWMTKTMGKTTPSGCVSAKVEIYAYSLQSNSYYGFTNVDDVSLTGCIPIAITSHPASVVKDVGQTATFSVSVTGEAPVYQWEKKPSGGSFAAISGANNSTYTTGALGLADSGCQYRCKVTNSCTTAYSNAATLTVINPTVVSSIAQAKRLANATVVRLPEKPVSARTSSAYWIEDSNPPSGIKVNSTAYPAAGSRVAVTGTLNTTSGERSIDPLTETWGTSGDPIDPFFMVSKSLGGSRLGDYVDAVDSAWGPHNVGLFVKMCGVVTNIGPDYYYVDDGAGLKDGTTTGTEENVGVRILASPGGLAKGNWATLTGISSTFASGGKFVRAIVQPGCTVPSAGLAVTAASSAICSGQSTAVNVAASETDVSYQLRKSPGNAVIGSPLTGTGGAISLPTGSLTASTTFNVLAMRIVGGCSVQLSQTATVTVNALPNAGLAVGATQSMIDVGESTSITVAGSQAGVNYQLRRNSDNSNVGGPVTGTGATISLPTGTMGTAGTYGFNVLATNASGCSQQLTQTVSITVGKLGTLTGYVRNARAEGVGGATVSVVGTSYTATTDASGYFTLSNVVAGTYSVTASAATYQSHTWERVAVLANTTSSAPTYYLPHNWSKIGWHIQKDNTNRLSEDFFIPIHNAGKTCQMVKCMGVFGKAGTAANDCPGSFSVGRTNNVDGVGDIQAYNEAWAAGVSPADEAWFVYYGTHKPVVGTGGLRRLMQLNPKINVWEVTNEWDAHYDWQSDFFLAMMDLAEADGFRIAAFGFSAGTPSLNTSYKFPGDTRTELENVARVCARAKAHGGHMLALHEYAYGGTLQSEYTAHPNALVGRYRPLHDYLKAYDDPSKGYVGADCPMIITECVGDCSAGDQAVTCDMAWYDQNLVRQDSYVLGVATWNIGWECDLTSAFLEMSNYICKDSCP